MGREFSCYGGGQFNGWRMIMLRDLVSLMEGERSPEGQRWSEGE